MTLRRLTILFRRNEACDIRDTHQGWFGGPPGFWRCRLRLTHFTWCPCPRYKTRSKPVITKASCCYDIPSVLAHSNNIRALLLFILLLLLLLKLLTCLLLLSLSFDLSACIAPIHQVHRLMKHLVLLHPLKETRACPNTVYTYSICCAAPHFWKMHWSSAPVCFRTQTCTDVSFSSSRRCCSRPASFVAVTVMACKKQMGWWRIRNRMLRFHFFC